VLRGRGGRLRSFLAWLGGALRVVVLIARLGGVVVGFLLARRRAARIFYRRLVRAGISAKAARELAEGYRGPRLRELLNRRG